MLNVPDLDLMVSNIRKGWLVTHPALFVCHAAMPGLSFKSNKTLNPSASEETKWHEWSVELQLHYHTCVYFKHKPKHQTHFVNHSKLTSLMWPMWARSITYVIQCMSSDLNHSRSRCSILVTGPPCINLVMFFPNSLNMQLRCRRKLWKGRLVLRLLQTKGTFPPPRDSHL